MNTRRSCLVMLLGGALALGLLPRPASACGCFTPPDATVPIVQAGERILFVQAGGETLAHIQIQYQGKPAEFGWILPLPSVPKNRKGEPGIELGADELFARLVVSTQPRFRITQVTRESCASDRSSPPTLGCGAGEATSGAGFAAPPGSIPEPPPTPLVKQDALGPYDFAILKADSKADLFKWLADNRYFVPAGTDQAVGPYIRPGAFFLALKLRAGQSSGDLQPVVVRYQSDLPLIPIVLTAVGAVPNMGIQVWMLGRGRAIPRNYRHLAINEAQINWLTAENYNDVVIKALGEVADHHAFVTEYAGTSALMRGVLTKYDDQVLLPLEQLKDPVAFVQRALGQGIFLPSPQVLAILTRHIPLPQALADQRVTLSEYYSRLSFYLKTDRVQNPNKYADIEAALLAFDPAKVVVDLRERIVTPLRDASALFDSHPYLTRLYTTLSPEHMTKDPAFSYNPSLPDVPLEHTATGLSRCDGRFTLTTGAGPIADWRSQGSFAAQPQQPYAAVVGVVNDTGAITIEIDNRAALKPPEAQGCATTANAKRDGASLLLGLLCAGWLLLSRKARSA